MFASYVFLLVGLAFNLHLAFVVNVLHRPLLGREWAEWQREFIAPLGLFLIMIMMALPWSETSEHESDPNMILVGRGSLNSSLRPPNPLDPEPFPDPNTHANPRAPIPNGPAASSAPQLHCSCQHITLWMAGAIPVWFLWVRYFSSSFLVFWQRRSFGLEDTSEHQAEA